MSFSICLLLLPNFLRVDVHVTIIDQYNRTARVRRTGTFGTLVNSADPDQTPKDAASDQVCTVCLNYRKLRVK